MSIKVVIFDLDQTLINETICQETEIVLQTLKKHQISMSVASFNVHAKWFCDRYDISKYFDVITANFASDKISHITSIMNFYNITNPLEIVFFDDKQKNCEIVQKILQIPSFKVNRHHGIRLCDVMNRVF